jgi:DNA polymerase III alpha subunit
MRIAALVLRSFYSLLRGAVSAQRLVQKATEYGYGAAALADVNTMCGVVDFCRAAKQANIKPIIGVEILTDSQKAVLLAEDRAGYKNICRITTERCLDENFDLVELLKSNNKGIICICNQPKLLEELKSFTASDYLFAGCTEPKDADFAIANGISPIAYASLNCLVDDDVSNARLLARIRQLSAKGPGPQDNCGFNKLTPEEQFKREFRSCPQAISNAEQIVQRCDFQLLNGKYYLPELKQGLGKNADSELARLCHIGLAKRYNPISREIVKRLEHELATIRINKFSDYFLVVHQIVNFAKRNSIPVDVRGSAAGSLVAYVLGFTRVCPIENNLYFERFMNSGRTDCPDIDIDLCWRRRDEVIRFCYEHWGFANVAMVCNINRYRPASAIRDTARALGFEPAQINQLAKQGESKTGSPLLRLAERLVGIPRHLGVHCGGIVITPCPVRDIAPLERANKGVIITQYDKTAAEAIGLVKIDLLGNRALSTVNEAVSIITKEQKSLDVDAVEQTDEKTAKMLSAGDSLGVFQSESPGMRQLLRALKVKGKKDLAIALSLIRPGPASGGMKAEFIQRYVNKKPFQYIHPKMKELLSDTYGVMLYQEDVMRIAVEVAGYSVADADRFRSEVSKKVSASRLQGQYIDFVYSRATAAGIDRQSAEAIWDEILRFAAYSYCKAHATVYANIAWQTAYLKAHYPQQFYCSLFNNHHGMYPLRVYVWDAKRHGIKVLPPHVNYSDIEWRLQGRAIRAGLGIIKALSQTGAQAIVSERAIRPFSDLDDLARRIRFRKPELQNLIHVGACDNFVPAKRGPLCPTRRTMLNRLRFGPACFKQPLLFPFPQSGVPDRGSSCAPSTALGASLPPPVRGCEQYTHYAILRQAQDGEQRRTIRNTQQGPRPAGTNDYSRIEKLKAELDLTGIPFSWHPALLLRIRCMPAARLGGFIGKKVTIAGFIATARRARTNDGRVMGFVTLEDSTGLAEVSFFPDQIQLYRSICSSGGPVWVKGRVTEHLSSITLECFACGKLVRQAHHNEARD